MGDAVMLFPPGGRLRASRTPEADDADTDQGIELVYQALRQRAEAARAPAFWPAMPPKLRLDLAERAGLSRLMDTLPDACGETELSAFVDAFRHAPAGDVIDLGAGYGSAAVLMAWLARRYEIGAVLSIDAWRADLCRPDEDEALRAFEINVAPFAGGRLNCERADPAAVAAGYGKDFTVRTPTFGETRYRGVVSLLRVGGEAVRDPRAIAAWSAHLAPAGWAVFGGDDRADPDACLAGAHAFAAAHEGRTAAMFQAGAAVFFQLRRDHA